jgi:tripartite-type tricarboxylate transporter receptor subunit TctC
MVIENRPGAGTAIGMDAVLRAPPDGYTLLVTNNSFGVIPHLRKLDFDPLASFAPVCNLAVTPTVVVVNAESPYRTLAELIRCRSAPSPVT